MPWDFSFALQSVTMNEKDANPQEERDASSTPRVVTTTQSEKVHFIDAYLRYRNGWPASKHASHMSREKVERELNCALESGNNFCCALDHYLSYAYNALIPTSRSLRTDVEWFGQSHVIWRPSGSQFNHWTCSHSDEPTRLEIAPGMVVESFMSDWARQKLPEKFRISWNREPKWAGARRQVPLIPLFGVQRWPEMEKFLENSRCLCSFKYEMLTGYSPVNKCPVEYRNGNTYPVRD